MNQDWNPTAKYEEMLHRIDSILDGGEQRTVRDIYYALEARGHDYDYEKVKYAVKRGRRAGYIDPEQIYDASRRAENTPNGGYTSPEQFVDESVDGIWHAYTENFWADQDAYLEVWLEKQSLASIFSPICREYNIRLEATRGDWSESKVYEATTRLGEKLGNGNDVKILYYGDFNPSGYHAPVSVQERMGHYGIGIPRNGTDGHYFDIWPFEGPLGGSNQGSLHFKRCAINLEHIEKFNLPENPNPSGTDKDRDLRERFRTHVTEGRDTNVELNALKEYHRDYLEDLIRESIETHIDEPVREQTEDRVAQAKEKIKKAVEIDRSGL